MVDISREEVLDAFLGNGLYKTSKMALKAFHDGTLKEKEFIECMERLFRIYEDLRGE